MTKKTWRILAAILTGSGVAVYAVELSSRGTLSTLGMIAFALMSIGFILILVALVKDW